MNEKNKISSLYVPHNIKTKTEFFQGFGSKELLFTVIFTAIATVVAILLYSKTQNAVPSVIMVLVSIAFSVSINIRDSNNMSIMVYLNNAMKFFWTQKRYEYYYERD